MQESIAAALRLPRNGYRNYLPTDSERPRGGYEIDISPFRPGADALVEQAAARVLDALA